MAEDLTYTVRTEYVGDGLEEGRRDLAAFGKGLVTAQKGSDSAAAGFGDLESTLRTLADENAALRGEVDELRTALAKLSEESDRTKLPDPEKPRKGFEGLKTAVLSAGLAMGAAFAGSSVIAVGAAQDAQGSVNQLVAQLGLSREEAEAFGAVGRDVFENNWGESITASTARVGQLSRALGVVDPAQLETLTTQAFAFEAAFGFAAEETERGLANLRLAFPDIAADSTKAFDLMTGAMQRGGPRAEDLMDTLNEYSVLMANLGVDSEGFFAILDSGLAAGARNTDFVADLFKEFGIRIADGSETTADALAAINLGHLTDQLSEGEITGIEAFQQIQAAIDGLDDPIQRNVVGVALMGTKYEDLGQGVVSALSTKPLQDFEGAALAAGDALTEGDIGAQFEGLRRQIAGALLPLGADIVQNFLLPMVEHGTRAAEALGPLVDRFLELPGPVRGAAAGAVALGGGLANAVPSLSLMQTLLGPGTDLLGKFGQAAGGAGGAGGIGGMKAAVAGLISPVGLLVVAMALLGAGVAQATAAEREHFAALEGTGAGITSYVAAATSAREESGLLGQAGFFLKDIWTGIVDLFHRVAGVVGAVGTAIGGFLEKIPGIDLPEFTNPVTENDVAIMQSAAAEYARMGLGVSDATLKSDAFLQKQRELSAAVLDDTLTTEQAAGQLASYASTLEGATQREAEAASVRAAGRASVDEAAAGYQYYSNVVLDGSGNIVAASEEEANANLERAGRSAEAAALIVDANQQELDAQERRGEIGEGEYAAEVARLQDRIAAYGESVAGVEGAIDAETASLLGLAGTNNLVSRSVQSSNAAIGDSARGMGADVGAGAARATSGVQGIPGAFDAAAVGVEGSIDGVVGAIQDGARDISSTNFDIAPNFDRTTEAIEGAGSAAEEAARVQVSANQDAARAAAAGADETAAAFGRVDTAAAGLVTSTGELTTAYESLPTEVETEVVLDDAAARSALKYVRDQMAAIDGKKIRFEIIGQYLGAGRAAAGSPLLVLQDLWAIQEAASRPFVLAGRYAGTGLATASGTGPLGLRTELEAIAEQAAHPVVFDVRAVIDPDFASFMRDLLGSEGAVSSAVRDELDAINGRLEDAQRVASGLADQIDFLRDGFLRGGEGDEGSLAWLMGEWERGGFEFNVGDLFSDLNIPVGSVEEFADLLDQLAASGQADRAVDLWNRFYDGITERQEAYHEQRMAAFEREREAAEDQFEIDKRRIEELIKLREKDFKEEGGSGDTPTIDGMSDEIDRIEAKYAKLFESIGLGGDTPLTDLYRRATGEAQKHIQTNDDLLAALDLLGDALGDHWDDLEGRAEADHEAQMAMLDERIRMISLLGEDHAAAEAEVNRLLAEREQLIENATRALQAQQKAAEDGEKQAHDLVMDYLDQQAEAREEAHDREMRELDLRRDAIEAQRDQARDIHDERLSQLKAEEDALKAQFEAEQKVIDSAKIALERLELGGELSQEQADLLRKLGIDPVVVAEAAKQIEQQRTLLDDLKSLTASLPDDDRSRVSLRGNSAVSEAETAALQKALEANLKNNDDTDLLSESDRRIIEVALAGGGVNTGRLRGILDKVTGKLEDDAAAADSGGALNPVEEARQILGLLENTQKTKKQQLDEDIAGIAARREAENQRWEREQANFDARIAAIEATKTAAKEAYDAERQAIDDAREAERQRHEDRMAQIQAAYALELLRLGKTEAEVQAIIAAQQASAARIAEESAKRWSDLQAEIAARQAAIRAEEEAARRSAEGREAVAPGRFPATPPAQPVPPGGEGGRGSGGIRKPGIGAGGAEIDLGLVTDALRDALDAAAPLGAATDDLARRLDDLAAADAGSELERMADELDRLRRDDPLGMMADDLGVLADSALKSALVVRDDFWSPMQDEALRLLSYTRDAKRELEDLMRVHADFERDRDRDDDDGPGGRPAARVIHIHGDVIINDRETAEDLGLLDVVGP